MKRFSVILLAISILFSLAACGTSGGASVGDNTEKVEFIPSAKASVISSFVVENEAKFTIELAQDADVMAAEIACMYFDAEGKLLKAYEIFTCNVNKKTLSTWETEIPTGGVYAVATIASTTDSSGTKDTLPNLNVWSAETEENFTVENHEGQIALWTLRGAKAEDCEYVKIEGLTFDKNSLHMEVTNLKNQDLSNFQIYILLFDKDGKPLPTGGNACPNSLLIDLDDLLAEETATYTYNAPEGAVSAKGVITKVVLDETTTWDNEYASDWLFANYKVAP